MRHLLAFSLLLAVSACSSSPKPEEVDFGLRYHHTRSYVWTELLLEVERKWRIASKDEEKGEIVTDWDVNLHGMDTFGRRHRLTFQMDGRPGEGYGITASQETEQNTNALNPISRAEAEWKPVSSDGALAAQFLMGFHRHMTPEETWRREEER